MKMNYMIYFIGVVNSGHVNEICYGSVIDQIRLTNFSADLNYSINFVISLQNQFPEIIENCNEVQLITNMINLVKSVLVENKFIDINLIINFQNIFNHIESKKF